MPIDSLVCGQDSLAEGPLIQDIQQVLQSAVLLNGIGYGRGAGCQGKRLKRILTRQGMRWEA